VSDDRTRLLQLADQAARKGDLAEAANCYRKVLQFAPRDLTVLQRLGDALARAGSDREARDVLIKLADEYWRGGFKARGLAVLRRAVRLGTVEADLLVLLGERTLELGHSADAREPLLEAAQLRDSQGDIAGATVIYRRIAEAMPRDLTSREALLRLANGKDGPVARAQASVDLALALALNGDAANCEQQLVAALQVEPSGVQTLARLPDLLRSLRRDSGKLLRLPAPPSELTVAAHAAWSVIAAAFAVRDDDAPRAARWLEPVVRQAANFTPRVRLWAGRVMLDLGDLATARQLILDAAMELAPQGDAQREITDVLTALVAREPGDRAAMDVLMRLTQRVDPDLQFRVEPSPTPTAAESGRASTGLEASGTPELPNVCRAMLLEAKSLLSHGLPERARNSLAGMPSAFRAHPEVLRFEQELARAASSVATPAAASRPKRKPAPLTHELEVVFEDDLGTVTANDLQRPEALIATAVDPSAEPLTTGPMQPVAAIPTPYAQGPDLGELSIHIQEALGDDDVETRYQMAIGLLEMGLEDQAIEMLEQTRHAPSRAIEAATLLVERRSARGEHQDAILIGEAALVLRPDGDPPMMAELLARLAWVAHESGDQSRAQRYVSSLRSTLPSHPALDELVSLLASSP
jgi:tetratricopeptide (TPR) repeat protein